MGFFEGLAREKWKGRASRFELYSVLQPLKERYAHFSNMFKWGYDGNVKNLGRCFVLRYHGDDVVYIQYNKVVDDVDRMQTFIITTQFFIKKRWLNHLLRGDKNE